MRRLYFLLPNLSMTNQVVNELLLERIGDNHIHVIAKDGIPLGDLPEANLLQKSDFIPAVERGFAVGGITGMLAGLAAITFTPAGLVLGGGTILGITLAGACVGAWAAGMIGVDVGNTQIKRFQPALEKGKILVMIDVPKNRVEIIEDLVHRRHPQAEMGGTEPQIPAFP